MSSAHREPPTGRTIAVGWPAGTPARPAGRGREAAPSAARTAPTVADPASRRPRRIVGLVALLLVLVIGLPAVLLGGESAEDAAAEFLDAVVAGDSAIIRAHAAPTGNSLEIALTDAVLTRAEGRVQDYSIDAVTTRGGAAVVVATFRSPRTSGRVVLRLDRQLRGPLQRPDWVLRPVSLPVLLLEMPVTGRALVVNGHELRIPAAQRPGQAYGVSNVRLRVLPGTYRVSTQAVGERLDPRPAQVAVPPVLGHWVSAPVPLELELTDVGQRQLLDRARDSLEACLASSSPRPDRCPFAAPDTVTATGSWDLLGTPELATGGHDGGFYEVGASFRAAFTVEAAGGDPASRPEERVHPVAVEARAVAVLGRHGQLTPHWVVPPRGPRPGVDGDA